MSLMLLRKIIEETKSWFIAQNAAHSTLTPRLIVQTVVLPLALKIGLTQGMNGEGIMRMDTVTVEEATVLGFSSLAYSYCFSG